VNCVLIRRDGFESAIEDSAAPIHDRTGRVTGAVIVFHDVSAARAMSVQMTHSAQHDVVTICRIDCCSTTESLSRFR